ncbi:MAG: ketoacyl-ACP synthase III [Firmicutes bacterium]|nr:ketoacyl-ACP synthase III [Bacillota bacterium]
MSFKIIGTGSCLPEKIVTNDDLANMVETSDEWIVQRVGVKQRHVAVSETAADLALGAALSALENSGTKPDELDLIIAATISGDDICPTVAGSVQSRLGASCPAFDISSACSGFIFALDTAAGFFARGMVKKALVIGAERISKLIDWSDRSTCVIFGDGAGAAVLESGGGYLNSKLVTKGGDDVIHIPSSHGSSPFFKKELLSPFIFMNGQETFKFAVNTMTCDIKDVVSGAGMTLDDVAYIVPHQANIRIIQFASKKLKQPKEKFFTNLDKYGNTSSASVPIALDELNRSGKLNRGDIIVLSAFGGGLSSGTCLIRW